TRSKRDWSSDVCSSDLDYLTGLEQSIEGSDKVEIVEELTYEVTDDSIDSQITVLADSGANVLFNAVSQPHLTVAALQKARDLGRSEERRVGKEGGSRGW